MFCCSVFLNSHLHCFLRTVFMQIWRDSLIVWRWYIINQRDRWTVVKKGTNYVLIFFEKVKGEFCFFVFAVANNMLTEDSDHYFSAMGMLIVIHLPSFWLWIYYWVWVLSGIFLLPPPSPVSSKVVNIETSFQKPNKCLLGVFPVLMSYYFIYFSHESWINSSLKKSSVYMNN